MDVMGLAQLMIGLVLLLPLLMVESAIAFGLWRVGMPWPGIAAVRILAAPFVSMGLRLLWFACMEAPLRGVMALWRWVWRKTPDTFGRAHWSTREEMSDLLQLGDGGIVLGHHDGEELRDRSDGHCLVLGPPGVGKSGRVYAPTLRTWPGSAVVLDVKGRELYDLTHKDRKQLGPVWRIGPTLEESDPYNVLDLVRWETPQVMGDLQKVVMALTSDTDEVRFRKHAQELLPGLMLHCHTIGHRDLASMRTWISAATPKARIKELEASAQTAVREAGTLLRGSTPIMQSMIWNTCRRYLSLWADEVVAQQTATSGNLDLTTLQSSIAPQTIYIMVPEADVLRLKPWLKVFFELLVGTIMSHPLGSQRHQLLMAWDEFRHIGFVPSMPVAVAMLRGFRVRIMLGLQSLKQLTDVYPGTSMLDSVKIWWCAAIGDPESGEVVSRKIGSETRVRLATNTSYFAWSILTKMQEGEIHSERRLLPPSEVSELPEHEALILQESRPSIRCTKIGYDAPPVSLPVPMSPRRKTQMLIGTSAALVLIASLGTWALWPSTTTKPAPRVSLSVPGQASTPDPVPTPEPKPTPLTDAVEMYLAKPSEPPRYGLFEVTPKGIPFVAAGVAPWGGMFARNKFLTLEACEGEKASIIEQQRTSAANADANARRMGFAPQRSKNPRTLLGSLLEDMPS